MNKKIFYIIGFVSIFLMTSCKEDVEIWDSETLAYSGRYVIKVLDKDAKETLVDYDGTEFRIFNTSENLKNRIWIDDEKNSMFKIKSKFELSGNSSSFHSLSQDFKSLSNNLYQVSAASASPTSLKQTKSEEHDYIRCAIMEGKILPKAATTKGGNRSDSLFLKIKLMSGTVNYTSEKINKELWADPQIPEFQWKIASIDYDKSKDKIFVVSGYRYTGLPEDK